MIQIITAQPGDPDMLGSLVAEAFHDLRPSRWLIGAESIRRQIFPRYFQILVENALASGVVCTAPERAAAALRIPVDTGLPAPPERYPERLAAATGPACYAAVAGVGAGWWLVLRARRPDLYHAVGLGLAAVTARLNVTEAAR